MTTLEQIARDLRLEMERCIEERDSSYGIIIDAVIRHLIQYPEFKELLLKHDSTNEDAEGRGRPHRGSAA